MLVFLPVKCLALGTLDASDDPKKSNSLFSLQAQHTPPYCLIERGRGN